LVQAHQGILVADQKEEGTAEPKTHQRKWVLNLGNQGTKVVPLPVDDDDDDDDMADVHHSEGH
jgi:hypothetical protein